VKVSMRDESLNIPMPMLCNDTLEPSTNGMFIPYLDFDKSTIRQLVNGYNLIRKFDHSKD